MLGEPTPQQTLSWTPITGETVQQVTLPGEGTTRFLVARSHWVLHGTKDQALLIDLRDGTIQQLPIHCTDLSDGVLMEQHIVLLRHGTIPQNGTQPARVRVFDLP